MILRRSNLTCATAQSSYERSVSSYPVLHELLTAHRLELIDRCREKVAKRLAPATMPSGFQHGIPLFLEQIIKTLQIEQTADPMQSRSVSGPSGGGPSKSELSTAAMLHGRELLKGGYSVDQVVHDYGDLCQAITDLAFERHSPVNVDEFRTLNRCLDNGIAHAVTEFTSQRDSAMSAQSLLTLNEQLGSLAHDLRDLIHTAIVAVAVIKTGHVGLKGSTGALLDRALSASRRRIDRALAEARATTGLLPTLQTVSLTDFVAEVKTFASVDALAAECIFTVEVEEGLEIQGDRDLLLTAVANLLHNAFKFTQPHSKVSLNAYAAADRIIIDVADHCGGLSPGTHEELFLPFKQSSSNRFGVGLGLSICRHNVEANNGVLRVRNLAGLGCVFTIDLPRQLPSHTAPAG
jgi:signal transduction histidine kinase